MAEWKGKTRGGSFGYLFFIFIIKRCGIASAYTFLFLVVPYFILFAPKATQSTWMYSRRILKYSLFRSMAFLCRNYYRLGQTLIDKIAIANGLDKKYRFLFEDYERFLGLLDSGSGAIIIGAHAGNWQIGSPFFKDYANKINIVLFDAEYRKIKEILKRHSVKTGYKVISVSDNSLSHVFAIKEALDNREYVCFQGDRYLNNDRLLEGTFLKHKACFPQGPFLITSKMRVPVVFYYAMRERKRTYRFHFMIADTNPGQTSTQLQQSLLKQYITSLEEILHKYPEQWFNYYDFWHLKRNIT